MAKNEVYREAVQKIEEARQSGRKELDLSSMRLTELPQSLGQLTQLQSLDLSDNQLKKLPASLGQLTQLQSLNLTGNELKKLPESLGRLTQLRHLDLFCNELETLPLSIRCLSCLEELSLSCNPLGVLPEVLREMSSLRILNLFDSNLLELPDWICEIKSLEELIVPCNQLDKLPNSLAELHRLKHLSLGADGGGNPLRVFPAVIQRMEQLEEISATSCDLSSIPNWLGQLPRLKNLRFDRNYLKDVPPLLSQLEKLEVLNLSENPLNPELNAAYNEGLDAVKRYLREKAEAQVVLNEAKLIFVGEGGVGKSSLLGAFRGEEWQENRDTTHGVETKVVTLIHPDNGKEITLNAWDFGGQPLYRPTHQLFFTAPAVYLALWDPRRGPKQCCVDEWIQMVKHRTYDDQRPEQRPRVLVVATNGGPKERRDHIDEEGLRKQFGAMIVGFHYVDSHTGYGLDELKEAIVRTADSLPCVGRSVPASWKRVLDAVRTQGERDPYISYVQFEALCREQQVTDELVGTYAAMLNELGYLIHYSTDPRLRDTVILKANWLSKAVSFILEDREVKDQSGLVDHGRLGDLWHDPARPEAERYPPTIHPVFLRLMERFELSYRVILPEQKTSKGRTRTNVSTVEAGTSLVSQLVPGARPESLASAWPDGLPAGDSQRVEICRITDKLNGQPAPAAGLLYRLIVRLHRYSLGRENYRNSCHWQRGLLIDDGFNGRALIEEIGGDIHVTVRAAYPDRLLHYLCEEAKWLVNNFWKGLNCLVTVPCILPCQASLEIEALIEARHEGRPEYPCPVCRKWLKIDSLLTTAPLMPEIQVALAEIKQGQGEIIKAVDNNYQSLSTQLRTLLSQADEIFAGLMTALTDEAKEGPRLFSFEPVDTGFFDRPKWVSAKFRVTLWCEYSRLPLPALNGKGDKRGVYELTLQRDWFVKAAPFLKLLTGTLSLVAPVASSATKLILDDAAFKGIEKQLDLGQKSLESVLKGGEKAGDWLGRSDAPDLEHGVAIKAHGAELRQLQAWLKEKDPGFGGLVRVQNKRQEFLWVHPQFETEY